MSTVWRKAMVALGLGDDEDYEDYDDEVVARPTVPSQTGPAPVQPRSVQPVANRTASVSPLPGVPASEAGGSVRFPTHGGPPEQPPVRTVSAAAAAAAASPVSTSGVRTIVRPTTKPHVVAPRSFLDAPQVADRFKAKQPVIVNLQGVERDLSRRLVDFSSGLCYGLGGQMEKIGTDIFLLTPADVEVSAEERQRLSESGYHES